MVLCCCHVPCDCLSPVCCCRDPRDCLSPVLVWSLPLLLSKDFRSGVVSDGFSNAEKGFADPGERSSRESLVRSRLVEGRSGRANSARGQMCGRGGAAGGATVTSQRGCVGSTGKPLPQGMEDGLRALRRQAEREDRKDEEDRRTKSLEAEKKELRARIEWRMEMHLEDEVESRKEILKSSRVCRKSFRKTLRVTCNSKCKRWSKEGTTSCQNTRKCGQDRKIYKASRTKEELCRRTVLEQKRRCGSSKRSKKRSVSFSCRTKWIRTRWRPQKWRQNFRVCRQKKKEEAVMLPKQVIAALEALWQQFIALGAN